MNISKWKLAIKYLFGGVGAVVDYLLDLLNIALDELEPGKRDTVQAVLNVALQVLATIRRYQWLCPAKWQSALVKTIAAVESVVSALSDLELTREELAGMKASFCEAVTAWKGDDDETCVDIDTLIEANLADL